MDTHKTTALRAVRAFQDGLKPSALVENHHSKAVLALSVMERARSQKPAPPAVMETRRPVAHTPFIYG